MSKNRFVQKLSSLATTTALAMGFAVAAARPLRAQVVERDTVQQADSLQKADTVSNAQPGHTYWKHPDYDGVLEVWRCPERGICAKVQSVNTQDPRVRTAVAKTMKKDVKKITDEDVLKNICGYEAQFREMKEVEPDHWVGKIWIVSRNTHFGVELKQAQNQEHLYLRGYVLGFFKFLLLGDPFHVLEKGNNLERIRDVPPPCKASPKTSPN
ncbi:MAG: hypothetical protein ACAH83_19980 [Alphaproteobacteria bacterium]